MKNGPKACGTANLLRRAMSRSSFLRLGGTDHQTVHNEDEFYFIISGTLNLIIGEERNSFGSGDAFFVDAGVLHRFEDFTDDFATKAVLF